LIRPFPINKRFQRTNRLRILLFPPSQSFEGLTAWELCLNTLEGTSFVVQVEGTSTWVFVTENKRGYIPCGSLLVKGFLQGWKEISRTVGRLGTGCRHELLSNQYKSLVFVFFFPTLLLLPQVAWGLDVGTRCRHGLSLLLLVKFLFLFFTFLT